MDIIRTLLPQIEEYVRRFPVTILTGSRLTGKKTLARAAFGKKPPYQYNFEDPGLRLSVEQDPQAFLNACQGNVIINEAHRVPQIFQHLPAYIQQKPESRLILMSNQNIEHLLLPEELAGQVGYLTLLPFGYEELTQQKNKNLTLPAACWIGGYPRMVDRVVPTSNIYFAQYIHNYIEHDARQLKSIEDTSTFLLFIKQCALRVGQLLNLTAIAKDCGIAVNTAKAWVEVLEKGYMIYRLPPHPLSFGRRVVKVPKLYFYDTGLLCYFLGIKEPTMVTNHESYPMIAENYLLNEIVKSFHHRGVPISSLYFWRDHRGLEVDCIIEHDGKLRAIELQPCTNEEEIDCTEIEQWKKLTGSRPMEDYILYGGKPIKHHYETRVVGWEDALSVTNGILIRDLGKFYKDYYKNKK